MNMDTFYNCYNIAQLTFSNNNYNNVYKTCFSPLCLINLNYLHHRIYSTVSSISDVQLIVVTKSLSQVQID